mgnify:CR=1 FL=1
MTLSVFQATITNENGDVLPGAEVSVILESTGLAATIYSTRGGAALSNPFFADASGFAQFYANAGEYRIVVTSGVFSRTWRYVRLGDGGAKDVGTAATKNTDELVTPVNSVADLAGFAGTKDDQQISLKGWHPDSDVGGGILCWDAAKPKTEHNGGTVFSPTVPFSVDGSYNTALGETDASGSGCWVRTVKGQIQTTDFGMGFGGDDSPRWQALLDDSSVGSVSFKYTGFDYKFLSPSNCTRDITITGDSSIIIDCTDSSFTGGYWTEFKGQFPQIENLGVNAVKGERSVTFASAPSLSPGDVFVIYNPTPSSWSGFRAAYFAGEFCKVVSVSGNTVTVAGNLYDDYITGDVNIYRLDGIKVVFGGGMQIKGDLSSGLLNFEFCTNSLINNVDIKHKNNSGIVLRRCFNFNITEPAIHNEGDGGDDYGISIANSQTVKCIGGEVYSRRHATATGGDGQAGAVPCRDLRFIGMTLSNDINSGTHCADYHGNTEDSSYIDCEIYGGVTWQGKDNGYVNCRISSLLFGGCILSAEVLGGTLYARGCKFYTFTNPGLSSRAVFDIGSNNTAVSSDTTENVTFEITGGELNGRNLTGSTTIMDMRNRGCNKKVNIIYENMTMDVNDLSSVVRTQLVSGTADSDFIIVDNLKYSTGPKGKPLCSHAGGSYLNFPHRLQKQTGTDNLILTTSDNFVSGAPVSFNWDYPRMPHVTTGRANSLFIGADQPIESASSLSISGLTMTVGTVDASNFTASGDVDVSWKAEISEV